MPRRDNRRPGKPAVDRDHASSRPQSALDSAAPCSLRQELPLADRQLADIRARLPTVDWRLNSDTRPCPLSR